MQANNETPVEAAQPAPQRRRRRWVWLVGLGLVGVLLFGAAFLGGRLLNGQAGPGLNLGNLPGSGLAGSGMASVQIKVGEPPAELPKTAPEVTGQLAKRTDNVLTLATIQGMGKDGGGVVMVSGDGGTTAASDPPSMPTPSGPQVDVVVTRETRIYRDSTFDDLKEGLPNTEQAIQQKAAESNLDEIGSTSFITVWGRKNGDRVIADVIFFSSPMVFSKKN